MQVLPPELTLDRQASFTGGAAPFGGSTDGVWTASGGRYVSTAPANDITTSTADLGVKNFHTSAWTEITATFSTTGIGGVRFDVVGTDRFKYAALDVTGQRVLIGHVTGGRWYVDASIAKSLVAGADSTLTVTIRGTTVSVLVNGTFALSFAFNAPIADGDLGVVSRSGTTSFDSFRVKTDETAFAATPWVSAGDATVTEGGPGLGATATVTLTLSKAATTATSVAWTTVNGTGTAGADYVASSGIATFAAGSTTAQITVSVVGDSVSELDELFSVALLGTTKLNLGRDAATVTILNDDKPSLSVTDATITEGNTGSANVTLTVTLSAVYSGTVTVSYATVAGTACGRQRLHGRLRHSHLRVGPDVQDGDDRRRRQPDARIDRDLHPATVEPDWGDDREGNRHRHDRRQRRQR